MYVLCSVLHLEASSIAQSSKSPCPFEGFALGTAHLVALLLVIKACWIDQNQNATKWYRRTWRFHLKAQPPLCRPDLG